MKPIDQVKVEVRRGNEKIHVVVPVHEVAVLRVVHRAEHVSVLEPVKRKAQLDPSLGAEWARLNRKYAVNLPDGRLPAVAAFPLGPQMLAEFGFGGSEQLAPMQEGAGVRDHAEDDEVEVEADKKASGKK